jgi:hypothetical protein
MTRLLRGERLPRRELKRAYNGSEGVPIREEVIARHGELVITRNSYGALCLNTPDVLFADIDFEERPGWLAVSAGLAVGLLEFVAIAFVVLRNPPFRGAALLFVALIALIAALVLAYKAAHAVRHFLVAAAGGDEALARRRVAQWVQQHPNWHVRLYRTPSGLRVLAMHRTFDPNEPAVSECFAALGTDPVYVRMCQRQHCFRARVSPKPWRIGIPQHLKPRPGVWPVAPERMDDLWRWVAEYERAARGFAACRFLEALGGGRVDPAAADVQRVHDELSGALTTLPLG